MKEMKNSKTCKYKWPTLSDAPIQVIFVGFNAHRH